MSPLAKRLLSRARARIATEDRERFRHLARGLIAHIDYATPLRSGEEPFSARLRTSGLGPMMMGVFGFFAAATVAMAAMMFLFGR